MVDRSELTSGRQVRQACRSGEWTAQTAGLAPGYAQANLVVLPRDFADEFLLFCRRNPQPCPLLDATVSGNPYFEPVVAEADLRTDLPRYRVWEDGKLVSEPTDVRDCWQDNFVAFLIGCSFTFEAALTKADIPVRHVELGCNVPMYRTNIPCQTAGRFHGPLVVSMRPMKPADAIRAVLLTAEYPDVHGAPLHIGFPADIGIKDLARPDFGDPVPVAADELPVFWACGVTPQTVVMASKPPIAITHSPGCMFVTDLLDETLRRFPAQDQSHPAESA